MISLAKLGEDFLTKLVVISTFNQLPVVVDAVDMINSTVLFLNEYVLIFNHTVK